MLTRGNKILQGGRKGIRWDTACSEKEIELLEADEGGSKLIKKTGRSVRVFSGIIFAELS